MPPRAAGALGYVAEGFMTTTQYNPEKFPLSAELKAKGVTVEQWSTICELLRKGKGLTVLNLPMPGGMRLLNRPKLSCV